LTDTDLSGLIDILVDLEREEIADFQRLLDMASDFRRLFEEEKSKLPYSINLLDEIHANENAHSRILRKLLMFSETVAGESRYPVLDLLMKYLGEPFAGLVQFHPVITAEKARIDLLVRDRTYAIIIENKINGAGDQKEQLQRYVEKLTAAKVSEGSIYVLYLTAAGGSPSESSWPESMRNRFGPRYREIDYRNVVYHFLKGSVLPYVAEKQDSTVVQFLRSALHQYVDYLEGRFHYREGERKMREKTRAYLEEKIGLANPSLSAGDKVALIRDNRAMLEEIGGSLYEAEDALLRECVKKADAGLRAKIQPHVRMVEPTLEFGRQTSRIRFYPHGWKEGYCVSVVFEKEYENLFMGIENTASDKYSGTITDDIYEKLREKLRDSEGPSNHWVYTIYLAKERDLVVDYFTDFEKIDSLAETIIAMAERDDLREIIK
jgi:hypothetical protein